MSPNDEDKINQKVSRSEAYFTPYAAILPRTSFRGSVAGHLRARSVPTETTPRRDIE